MLYEYSNESHSECFSPRAGAVGLRSVGHDGLALHFITQQEVYRRLPYDHHQFGPVYIKDRTYCKLNEFRVFSFLVC